MAERHRELPGINPTSSTSQQLENDLAALNEAQLEAWTVHRLDQYSPPKLDLETVEGCGPYAKPGSSYTIAAAQVEPLMCQVKKQCEHGYVTEVQDKHGVWVSPAFGKSKEALWHDTNITMYRLLADLSKLNAVLKKPPAHWVDSIQDSREIPNAIPVGAGYFLPCGISGAFSTCELTDRAHGAACFKALA